MQGLKKVKKYFVQGLNKIKKYFVQGLNKVKQYFVQWLNKVKKYFVQRVKKLTVENHEPCSWVSQNLLQAPPAIVVVNSRYHFGELSSS